MRWSRWMDRRTQYPPPTARPLPPTTQPTTYTPSLSLYWPQKWWVEAPKVVIETQEKCFAAQWVEINERNLRVMGRGPAHERSTWVAPAVCQLRQQFDVNAVIISGGHCWWHLRWWSSGRLWWYTAIQRYSRIYLAECGWGVSRSCYHLH